MKPHSIATRERHSGFSGYPWRTDLADSISGPGKQRSRLTAGSCRAFDGKRALSVAMISIANLESNCRELAEDAARTALIEGAKRVRSLQRGWDTRGRYGDKLFIAILRDADADLARERAGYLQLGMDFPFVIGVQILELPIRIGLTSADFLSYTPQASELVDAAMAAHAIRETGP